MLHLQNFYKYLEFFSFDVVWLSFFKIWICFLEEIAARQYKNKQQQQKPAFPFSSLSKN